MTATLVAISVATALIVVRAPVGMALLTGSVAAILIVHPDVENTVPLLQYRIFDNFSLLAAPLFIVAANLMLGSGALDSLVTGLRSLGNRRWLIPPGIVGMAMFFAGITGSSIAEAAAFGKLAYPVMRLLGFPARKVAGLIATSATLGVLLPPSLTLIFYGTLTQTPVSQLFLASLIPGVLSVVAMAALSIFLVRPEKEEIQSDTVAVPVTSPPANQHADVLEPGAIAATAFEGESELLVQDGTMLLVVPAASVKLPLPTMAGARRLLTRLGRVLIAVAPMLIVFGGIYGGIATPSESAALLVLYAAIVMMIRRGYRGVAESLQDGAAVTASVFLVIMGATTFAFVATLELVPQRLAAWVVGQHFTRIEFILILSVILFFLGGLLDGLSLLLVTVPLVFPAAIALGISPIQLGIIMAVNIEHAAIMPPIGINLFVVSAVSGVSYRDTVRSVLAWYPASIAVLIAVAVFPWLTVGIWHF